jgi:hypothetical protein
MNEAIAGQRLHNQSISRPAPRSPARIVAWLGAVQAQDYAAARWALGLRLSDTTDAAIAHAFDAGRILRTHVLRPTWHFVTPADIRWMLDLTAPHVQRAMAYQLRQLELDVRVCTRAIDVMERALGEGEYLTRGELGARLARSRIVATGNRLAQLAAHAELEAVICSGPRRGKQFTYALLATRAQGARRMPRDEALAELTRRFFQSHAPATIRDFVWWSGLRVKDAATGATLAKADVLPSGPSREKAAGADYLLPNYDEYLIAYRDRDAVPHGPSTFQPAALTVTFQHAVIIAGEVTGTWRTSRKGTVLAVDVFPLRRLSRSERARIAERGEQYGRFLGAPLLLSIR